MAASSLASSKLKNIPSSLLYSLIRRNSLHPYAAAAASNLIPSTSSQSPYLFLLQNDGVKSPVDNSTAYSPISQFGSSMMQIEAARTYVTKDDHDYVDEEFDDIDDFHSDEEEDIENYSEYIDDEDESEDSEDE